jgi:hypothetical protein
VISSILITNIRNACIRDDAKMAQLMQDDEFIQQVSASPEFRAALAEGLSTPRSPLAPYCEQMHGAIPRSQSSMPTAIPWPRSRRVRCWLVCICHALKCGAGGKASAVLKGMMKKFTVKRTKVQKV